MIGTFIISQTLWEKTNGKALLQPKKTPSINQINHRYWSILTHFGSPACAAGAAPGAAAYPAHKACFQQLLSPGVQTVQLLHGTYRDQEQFTLCLNNSTSLTVAFKCNLQKLRIQHWLLWKQLFVFKWNSFRYITNLKTLHTKYLSLDQKKMWPLCLLMLTRPQLPQTAIFYNKTKRFVTTKSAESRSK